MGLLDKLYGKVQDSVNEVTTRAGLNYAPRDESRDLLQQQLSAFESRRAAQEEERKRREREEREAREAAERQRKEDEAALRRAQAEQKRKADEVERERSRITQQATNYRETNRLHAEQAEERTVNRLDATRRFNDDDDIATARRMQFVQQNGDDDFAGLRFDVNEAFTRGRDVSLTGFGRGGVQADEFNDLLKKDAAAALALHPRFSVLPDSVANAFGKNTGDLSGSERELRDIVAMFRFGADQKAIAAYIQLRDIMEQPDFAERMAQDKSITDAFNYLVGKENQAVREYEKDRHGKFGEFVASKTGGLPGPDILGTITQSAERFAGAAASIPLGASEMAFGVGGDTSKKIAESVGIHGDDDFKTASAVTVNTAADVASLVPLAASGSLVTRFGKEVAANLLLDIPALAVTMYAYDIDPTTKEGMQLIALTLGVDLAGGAFAAGVGPATGAAGRGFKKAAEAAQKVPGGDVALQSVIGAGVGATGAKLTGNDTEKGALLGAALPVAVRIGDRLGRVLPNNPRVQRLTHEFGVGEALHHGSPYEVAGGVPTRGRGTGGAGAYVTSDQFNAASYGDVVYDLTPNTPLRFLDLSEYVDADEIASLLAALDKRVASKVEVELKLAGNVTGFDAFNTVRREIGEEATDAAFVRAGWDGYGWPASASEYADEFVVKGTPDQIREKLSPVGVRTADEIDDEVSDGFLSGVLNRAEASRAGAAPPRAFPVDEMVAAVRATDGYEGDAIGLVDRLIEATKKADDTTFSLSDYGFQYPEWDAAYSALRVMREQAPGGNAAGLVEGRPRVNAPFQEDMLAAGGAGAVAALQGDDTQDRFTDAAAIAALTLARRRIPRQLNAGRFDPVMGVRTAAENAEIERALRGTPVIDAGNPRGVITAQQIRAATNPVVTAAGQPKKLPRVSKKQAAAVAPKPEHIAEARRMATRFSEAATNIANSDRAIATALRAIPGLSAVVGAIDPASKFSSYYGKRVLSSVVSSANYLRYAAGTQNRRANLIFRQLGPLIGDQPHLKNALKQGVALGAPIAAGEVATQATDNDLYRELGIVVGAGAIAATSAHQRKNVWRSGPWEAVTYVDPSVVDTLPDQLTSGPGKLYDILQNPTRYNLSPEQLDAIRSYHDVRVNTLTRQTNAFLAEAGFDPITPRENHGILQFFEPGSVADVFPHEKSASKLLTPGFGRKSGPQLMRDLGDSYEEVLTNHPKLEVARNPFALIEQEVKFHDQIRALAIMTKSMKESGGAYRELSVREQGALTKAQHLRYKTKMTELRNRGFKQIPGIEDHLFHPDLVDAVDDLLLPTRGRETGFLSFMDAGTNFLRQAMFTSDLSAWSMQGAMTMIEDPMGTIRNAHHLVGATFGGQKYFNHWLSNNKELWEDFTAAGAVAGREFEGIELETFSIAKLPGLRNVEKSGFEQFLPIHRALMFDNVRSQNAVISKLGLRGAGRSDIGQLTAEFAKNGPLVAGVLAGADIVDIPGLEDEDAMALLMGVALGFSVREVMAWGGRGMLRGAANKVDIDVGAAKHVNRISGAFNRQALGVTADQSQLERIFLARSPALTRNTLILAKHALTDFGPEGAAARFYLLKTAALLGTAMAAYEYAATGEWDSFDPRDPDSVFNPLGFAKANAGADGKLAFSNPNISLMRALMRVERDDDVKVWRFEDWEPVLGLRDWYAARTPDIAGKLTGPLITTYEDDGDNDQFSAESMGKTLGSAVPLSIQGLFETGLADKTHLGRSFTERAGKRFGLAPDDRYTNDTERVTGALAQFGGLNFNPESLGAESVRLRNEAVTALYPDLTDRNKDGLVDYNDLNQEQRENVKELLAGDDRFGEVKAGLDDQERAGLADGEQPGNVRAALDARDDENNRFLNELKDLDRGVRAGLVTKEAFVDFYKELREDHRSRLDTIERTLFTQSAEREGTDETVRQYLDRNQTPEDAAVEGYYDLFEKSNNKFGKTNFDKLAREQDAYLKALDPQTRAYVERRVAKFDKPSDIKSIADYEKAQEILRPYWDKSDEQFRQYRDQSPTLAQFESRGDFEEAMASSASARGMSVYDLIDVIAETDVGFAIYQSMLQMEQQLLRMIDPEIDALLTDYYGYSPKNIGNIIQSDLASVGTELEVLGGGLTSPEEDANRVRREALYRSMWLPEETLSTIFGRR